MFVDDVVNDVAIVRVDLFLTILSLNDDRPLLLDDDGDTWCFFPSSSSNKFMAASQSE